MRDSTVALHSGDLFIVPRGVKRRSSQARYDARWVVSSEMGRAHSQFARAGGSREPVSSVMAIIAPVDDHIIPDMRRMKNPGKPTIYGNRIVLRPLGASDAAAMYRSLQEPVSQRLTGTHGTFSFEDVRAHCSMIETAGDRWDYGIMVGGKLIGEAVLNQVNRPNKSASFRMAIWEPEERGRGYGTEAARLLVDFGFRSLVLNRIELEVYAFNPWARRVYEKVGFKYEGTKREALIWQDEKVDAHVMSILRDEYLLES